MSEKVILELPEELVLRARALAERARRPVEEILVEWIDRAAAEPPPGCLSDEELLELCAGELDSDIQEDLSDLLERRGEGELTAAEQVRLDELMQLDRRDRVRKAQAMKAVVARGLRPRLA